MLEEIQERSIMAEERKQILRKIIETAKQKLDERPTLNQKIDDRETLLKSVELLPLDPSCQEVITLELIKTNLSDDKPKEQVIIITSKVFTPSTGEFERVYDFSLNPLSKDDVWGARASHNTHKFTNKTFQAISKSIKDYQARK